MAHSLWVRDRGGVNPATADAIASGKRPRSLKPDERIVYNFCTELLNRKAVTDATFQAAIDKFGERSVVELTALVAFTILCL
jgi:4-carboxymuconolactone decarboxylase